MQKNRKIWSSTSKIDYPGNYITYSTSDRKFLGMFGKQRTSKAALSNYFVGQSKNIQEHVIFSLVDSSNNQITCLTPLI